MIITSTEFKNNDFLQKEHEFNEFGGNGNNRSPELAWREAPAETKSFAITAYDPDAPTGSGFWHWVAFDIPVAAQALVANAGKSDGSKMPIGTIQSRNDYGFPGFCGPCPPVGNKAHRYIFTIHALSVEKLGIDAETTNAVARFMIQANTLATATITSYYQR
ncbi:YbhB/YbcL family Raf kinase inhibitor-like protein [Xenorhabdus nematophila]|uniref:DLP12 prophage protein with phosphatidylethanolamine-binding domain n=2 Tax=Xenorhabdus nematophila TaxID=628 RepID=D3VKR4_XENNA|nr:YbhB/YbcL family Raf kinase inhibitor-like protein [Xenorhabdus nematophila]CBJ91172.1 DLP12 prophage; protein with phosphatidylethanolamine-binding domain [Xenorhabdus nematophila ATCC 19061]KHD28381.1 kinase inhibitor [Xenorhabdus nematophila]MBA0017855.1 YbhB/YbcL family Raf kinase inhibitor-like protein [Xenorhabdus nematophila]MCB4425049.1 YbhB/YbcL family Raf kinase inhibitor-like protein [Xenorhabdus nematophila]